VDGFKTLQPGEQRAAASFAEPVVYQSGQIIYEEQLDATGMIYVICKGVVQLSRKEFTDGFPKALGAGDTFGLVAGQPTLREETARTMSKTFLLAIRQSDYDTLTRSATNT
jgi:signal-transduction protein with cAMP-binding, CBS, and nucleotidyltransferase domain